MSAGNIIFPDDLFNPADIKEYLAESIRLSVSHAVDKRKVSLLTEKLDVQLYMADIRDGLICQLETYIHALPDQKITFECQYPRDWWESFKERWFPKWLLGKFPVIYTRKYYEERKYKAVCPHLVDEEQKTHLRWMAYEEDL
jgi:hypothetical protein